jgi:pyruvate ferredoxin oxidoreductase delta subunit
VLDNPRGFTRRQKEEAMSNAEKDQFVHAHSKLCRGEAGRTGDWRSSRPEIDLTKCTPSKNNRPSCFLCWLYCPEGVVTRTTPVKIDMEYCKGCGICARECPTKAIKMVDERQEG